MPAWVCSGDSDSPGISTLELTGDSNVPLVCVNEPCDPSGSRVYAQPRVSAAGLSCAVKPEHLATTHHVEGPSPCL